MQYAAVFLFIPVFICGLIASEREERTLELLLTTQLLDREIVLGKLGSRLAVTCLIFLSTVPFMSLVSWFGGVDPAAIWRVFGATLLAVLNAGRARRLAGRYSTTAQGSRIRQRTPDAHETAPNSHGVAPGSETAEAAAARKRLGHAISGLRGTQ